MAYWSGFLNLVAVDLNCRDRRENCKRGLLFRCMYTFCRP